MLGGKTFRPREKRKDYLPLPATFNKIHRLPKKMLAAWAAGIVFLIVIFNPIGMFSWHFFGGSEGPTYPPPHPYTSRQTIPTTSKYIFPPVEHAPLLQELGRKKLVYENRVRDANHPEIDQSVIFSLNKFDDPDQAIQMNKEKDENTALDLSRAKNMFKNHDKVVYKPKNPKNQPEVVIVTAIDFEKYSLGGLTTSVQNRVDYAHEHKYGVYVRWAQEFLPWMNSFANFDKPEKRKWVRIFSVRAAMHAFPEAKYFWYFDEDGLIMNMSIDMKQYVLADEALGPIMLRDHPVAPRNGIVKTYKSSKPQNVRLLLIQSPEKIETTSFIVKNDDIGKSMVEFWANDLYFEYPNFPYGPDSAITHILQWHPFLLSRSALIPGRTIGARHSNTKIEADDHIHYVKGDFTVSWSDCKGDQCEATLSFYNAELNPKKP